MKGSFGLLMFDGSLTDILVSMFFPLLGEVSNATTLWNVNQKDYASANICYKGVTDVQPLK